MKHFKDQYKEIVLKTEQIRKEVKHSQSDMAQWVGVSRKRYIEFEKAETFDIDLLLKVCEKLGVDVSVNYKIN